MVGLSGVGALSCGFLVFVPLTLCAEYSVADHMDRLSALWVTLYCVCTGLYFVAMSKAAALWSPTHVALIALADAATGPLCTNWSQPHPCGWLQQACYAWLSPHTKCTPLVRMSRIELEQLPESGVQTIDYNGIVIQLKAH